VDDLRTRVYEQAREKRLLNAPVAHPVTGAVVALSDVITEAKTTLTNGTPA
jgi:hypothetical protein